MRLVFVRSGIRAGIPAALLACALVAGCDDAPPPPAAPAQACNCQPAPVPAPAPTPEPIRETRHHTTHHRTHYATSETDTESATTEYDYVSDSRVASYEGEHRVSHASGYTGGALWIDGYGRAYHADHATRSSGTMTRGRLKPWAHYDEDCDER